MKESNVLQTIRMKASELGWRIFRNNSGALHASNGNFIRFGLGNESFGMNKIIKSGDLIGIRPVLITQEMVGTIIGQFVSLEVKRADWQKRDTDHEKAQRRWCELINDMGGYAIITNNSEDLN